MPNIENTDAATRICVYCMHEKKADDFSLEHVVPQFLGGAYLPDQFKTRRVCKSCNNNLGLFVDASFEKTWLINTQLTELAYDYFHPDSDVGLPFRCMGTSDLAPPSMADDEVCEYWLGPLGEQAFWMRPRDERFFWYSGGNPRAAKSVRTRAYFLASERSLKSPILTLRAFRDAYKGKKVRRVSCTEWEGFDLKKIGFQSPAEQDHQNVAYLLAHTRNGQGRHNRVSINVVFDQRFLAKLALGVAHSYFGLSPVDDGYQANLRQAVWKKPDDPEPKVFGSGFWSEKDDFSKRFIGLPIAVTLTLLSVPQGVVLHLNIRQKFEWTILCAAREDLTGEQHASLRDGLCFVIARTLQKAFKLGLPELVAHNTGSIISTQIASLERIHREHKHYFRDL